MERLVLEHLLHGALPHLVLGAEDLRPAGPRRGARSPAVLLREVQAPSLVSLSVDRWAGVRSMR
jgi:hypothetical protein